MTPNLTSVIEMNQALAMSQEVKARFILDRATLNELEVDENSSLDELKAVYEILNNDFKQRTTNLDGTSKEHTPCLGLTTSIQKVRMMIKQKENKSA